MCARVCVCVSTSLHCTDLLSFRKREEERRREVEQQLSLAGSLEQELSLAGSPEQELSLAGSLEQELSLADQAPRGGGKRGVKVQDTSKRSASRTRRSQCQRKMESPHPHQG